MMKPIFSALLVLFVMSAQAQKYGFINSAEILEAMPEVKTANAELDKVSKEMQAQIKVKSDKLQEDSKKFSTKSSTATLTQTEYSAEVAKLEAAQKDVTALETEMNKTLDAKQQALMKPIYEKLNKAVKEVSIEKGAAAVFFSDVFAYADETVNFTAAVKAKLGVK
jgi:outer membrane protein